MKSNQPICLIQKMKILFFTFRNSLSNFNVKKRRKISNRAKQLKALSNDALIQLKKKGFKSLRRAFLPTWKKYDRGSRMTFLGKKGHKFYVIKVFYGYDEKATNSINFQNKFNSLLDFIPKGFELKLDGFKCLVTEFIDNYNFSYMKYIVNDNNILYFLKQIVSILNELYNFRIVHCDLENVNILIQKKTFKLFLIDFDTCCSEDGSFHCSLFPKNTIKQAAESDLGTAFIYDDAFSFVQHISRWGVKFNNNDVQLLIDEIKSFVGRNIYVETIR